jgi:5-(carboxyamino)imidazole ribonucleotide synthase
VIGIIGGGQLARMMYQAAISLDLELRILADAATDPAAVVAPSVMVGDYHDPEVVGRFAATCDVVTFDHELVPPEILDAVESAGALLRPSASAMRRASSKSEQRHLAAEVGIAVPPHRVVTGVAGLRDAVDHLGLPVVAKATQGGYDGRGVRWLRSTTDVESITDADFSGTGPLLVEPDLVIDAELATQVVRTVDRDQLAYPVVRTEQDDGICTTVTAPASGAGLDSIDRLATEAHAAASRLVEVLDYVGLLAIEFFVVDGELLLNELAPRPHNSGHYTIDACVTSQFENHVRAVAGLPLGDPELSVPASVMANIIATDHDVAPLHAVDLPPRTSVHLYGKSARPDRKIGHVTACGHDPAELREAAVAVAHDLAHPRVAGPNPSIER